LRSKWGALARALRESGQPRVLALRDVLVFRDARHQRFPEYVDAERAYDILEGFASTDGRTQRVPAPGKSEGTTISGDGWTFKAAPGWIIREGQRPGDYEVVRQQK